MSHRADAGPPWRAVLLVLGAAVALLVLVPPVLTWSRRDEFVAALQFGALGIVAPALLALGASRSSARGRLSSRTAGNGGAALVVAAQLAALVAWRLPPVIDGVQRHPLLLVPEALTLLACGVAAWLLLVGPAAASLGDSPLRRLVLAPLPMWTVWAVAYAEDMSGGGFATVFHHVAGTGLSAAADRQVATAVLFAVAACAYAPVVFVNLMAWLGRTERSSWRDEVASELLAGRGGASAS